MAFAHAGRMALREFVDSAGVTWRAWSSAPLRGALRGSPFAEGWLTFESTIGERRRLAPVPENWHALSDRRLELLCRAAKRVEVRSDTGPHPAI